MMTEAFSQTFSKLLSELMLVTDDLFFIYKDSFTWRKLCHTTLVRSTIPDPSCPHCLVQLGVNTHIGGLHLLIRKLFDGFDGTRGSSLKPTEKKQQKLHHRSHNNSLDSWANWTIIFSLKLLIIWTPQFFISNSTRQQKKSRDFPSLIHTDTSDAEIVCQSVGLSNETLQGETRNGERLMRVF